METRQKPVDDDAAEVAMNLSWFRLFGGGLAAAATVVFGANATDLASSFLPAPTPERMTVYVEQPIVEAVAPAPTPTATELPPLVIAVLPAPAPVVSSESSATADPIPPYAGGPVATPRPPVVTPPPPPPPQYWGDDDDDDDDDEGWDD